MDAEPRTMEREPTNIGDQPEVYRSTDYPQYTGRLRLIQEYATNAYLALFFVLMVFIYYRLLHGLPLWPAIPAAFLLILASNYYGMIRMRKIFVEIGFSEDQFYIKNLYDVAANKPPLWFDKKYANIRRNKNQMWINYYGRTVHIDLKHWKIIE